LRPVRGLFSAYPGRADQARQHGRSKIQSRCVTLEVVSVGSVRGSGQKTRRCSQMTCPSAGGGKVVVREESGLPRFFEALPWIGASLHLQERDVLGLISCKLIGAVGWRRV